MTITRQRITEISDGLKRWYAESLDVAQFSPERARQFHRDVAHGLNDCLAYIEQMDAEHFKLAAGTCEHRGGNEHGNPLCLKTNQPI